MREILTHKQATDLATGEPTDLPGAGPQAYYRLFAEPFDLPGQPKFDAPPRYEVYRRAHGQWEPLCKLKFQTGPFTETTPTGVPRALPPNGLTNELVLAVLVDRFAGYQTPRPAGPGPLPCPENAAVLEHLRAALALLHARTAGRLARGVEGRKEA